MSKSFMQFIFIITASVMAAHLASAAGPDTDVYRLGEVVVTADDGVVEKAGTVVTVDAAQIEERGARTLEEALALVPGLNIRTGGDGTPRIDIRGFRTRHVMLLLDGTPFNATFDGQFDPAFIPVENIAEIRVTTGGSSVLYGPGGNGGVINIITKKGRPGAHAYLAGEGGEDGAALVKAAESGGSGPADFFVSASGYNTRGFRLSDDFVKTAAEDGKRRENSGRKHYNIFANAGWTPSQNTMVGLTFNYIKGQFGKPPVTNFSAADPFTSNVKYDRNDDTEGFTVQVAASHDFAGPLSVRGWAYHNQMDALENRYDDMYYSRQVKNGSFSEDSTTMVSGANVQVAAELGAFGKATVAGMFENDDWDSAGFNRKGGKRVYFHDSKDYQVYTGAVEYEVMPLDNAGFVAGYAHHLQRRDAAGSDDDFSYHAGAWFEPVPGTRIKAAHERKVRFPSVKQLYETSGGNPDLRAEQSVHYEAGVEQALPAQAILGVTYFFIDVKDYIEKDAASVNRNFEKYRFEGVEVSAESRVVENLVLRAAWSYLRTKDLSAGNARRELQYRPRHKVSGEARYRAGFGLTADTSVVYIAGQSFYDKAGVERKELNEYALVGMKLSQRISANADVYVGVRNLLDKNYEQSYGLPQAGRTIYGGVEFRVM